VREVLQFLPGKTSQHLSTRRYSISIAHKIVQDEGNIIASSMLFAMIFLSTSDIEEYRSILIAGNKQMSFLDLTLFPQSIQKMMWPKASSAQQ